MDATIIQIIFLIIGVLAGSGGLLFAIKKFGLTPFNVAKTIVEFVKNALLEAGWTNEDAQFDNILDAIIQTLTYVQSISTGTLEEKINYAMEELSFICDTLNLVLSEKQIEVIETVFRIGFICMSFFGVTSEKLSKNKSMKLYRSMSSYYNADVKLSIIANNKLSSIEKK